VAAAGAGAAAVLDGDADLGDAEQRVVLVGGVGAGEARVAGAGVQEQPLVVPDRADAQHVAHLVQDHVHEFAVGLHAGEVGRVELHEAAERQERPGPETGRRGLAEDAAGAVDARGRGVDQEVVDEHPAVGDVGQVGGDDPRPPRRGRGERGTLGGGQV
jgi:hypothetical protein